jgi:hypothetical protein
MNTNQNNTDRSLCEPASVYYYDYIESGTLEDKALEQHIRNCPACQKRIEELKGIIDSDKPGEQFTYDRQSTDSLTSRNYKAPLRAVRMIEAHYRYEGAKLGCGQVKPFLPTLLIESAQVSAATPVTVHIDNCSECREDLQRIRRLNLSAGELIDFSEFLSAAGGDLPSLPDKHAVETARIIKNRPESGIKTVCRLSRSESGKTTAYPDSPVETEVIKDVHKPDWRDGDGASIFFPSVLKMTAAAAAVILLAGILWLSSSNVGAVGIEKLYDRLSDVKNVYKAKFAAADALPVQQEWISRQRQISVVKNSAGVALWDFRQGYSKIKRGDKVQLSSLSESETYSARQSIEGAMGIIPFASLSQLPAGAKWEKLENIPSDTQKGGFEVYDLSWSENSFTGEQTEKKWRFFINSSSQLPEKVKVFSDSGTGDLQMVYRIEIDYPGSAEMNSVIRNFQEQLGQLSP